MHWKRYQHTRLQVLRANLKLILHIYPNLKQETHLVVTQISEAHAMTMIRTANVPSEPRSA